MSNARSTPGMLVKTAPFVSEISICFFYLNQSLTFALDKNLSKLFPDISKLAYFFY